jgi:hypothetical protein
MRGVWGGVEMGMWRGSGVSDERLLVKTSEREDMFRGV